MAVLGRAALLLISVLIMSGCRGGAGQWGPFRGQIVDAETGAPIPNAHVMVSWERDIPNPVHWTQRFYDAQEAVTDADGRFEIPRERRFFTLLVSPPRIRAFAAGYVAESEEVTPPRGRPYVDATTLRMRLLGTRVERCRRLPGGPEMSAIDHVPRFRQAVQNYRSTLSCPSASEADQ